MPECQRALAINEDDIEAAANWLAENGENERDKKTITCKESTLLCEADVISANLSRLQNPELSLKSDTLLTPDHVIRGSWTMDS